MKACKHKKLILGAIYFDGNIVPDAEPYKAGEKVEIDPIPTNQTVYVNYCPKCNRIVKAWIE